MFPPTWPKYFGGKTLRLRLRSGMNTEGISANVECAMARRIANIEMRMVRIHGFTACTISAHVEYRIIVSEISL